LLGKVPLSPLKRNGKEVKKQGGKGKTHYLMKQDIAPRLGLAVLPAKPSPPARCRGTHACLPAKVHQVKNLLYRERPELVFT